jgi:hypothetical protein
MKVKIELICGLMFGFEYMPEFKAAMIDVGVIRIFFDWSGEDYVDFLE